MSYLFLINFLHVGFFFSFVFNSVQNIQFSKHIKMICLLGYGLFYNYIPSLVWLL